MPDSNDKSEILGLRYAHLVPFISAFTIVFIYVLIFYWLEADGLSALATGLDLKNEVVPNDSAPDHAWRTLFYGISLVGLLTALLWNIVVQIYIIFNDFHWENAVAKSKDIMVTTLVVLILSIIMAVFIFSLPEKGFAGNLTGHFTRHLPERVQSIIE